MIFSRSEDQTTFEVVRWLKYINSEVKVMRINSNDIKQRNKLVLDHKQCHIYSSEQWADFTEISSVWYRKGAGQLNFASTPVIPSNAVLEQELQRTVNQDTKRVTEYFHFLIKKHKETLGVYEKGDLNKLITMSLANDSGLQTADFIISNLKSELLAFIERQKGSICKSISDGLYLFDNKITNQGYFNYTEIINAEILSQYDSDLPASLVQAMVVKKYEIRSFFLKGKFFSTAIFSQNDEQTKVDYRRYNEEKSNRTIPYQLPVEIEKKLTLLFKKLDLNTGSVDLIVDSHNNYIFLEINPVGQFSNHSMSCNFGLEKKVAEALLNEN